MLLKISRNKSLAAGSLLLLLFLQISACDLIQVKEEPKEEKKVIARAKTKYLYESDLEGLISSDLDPQDSADRVSRFIDDWARKQLLIEEASEEIDFNEAEIERKILDYRYSLIGYEYQKHYIMQNLNDSISDEQIVTYYEENQDNFVLKQNIIRGKYVKVPVEAPRTNRLKRLIQSNNPDDLEELMSYCLSFATSYQLYDSVWMVFEDVVRNSPMAEIPNKVQFLKRRKFIENADDDFLYYLKIDEYRISDNVSPLEFVRDQIKSIILNKRKVELAKKLENEVYENAIRKNEFEIYN